MTPSPVNRRIGALALAVFVSAGVIKSSPAMAWIPADLTAIMAVAVAVYIFDTFAGMLCARSRPPLAWLAWALAIGLLGLFGRSLTGYAEGKVPALLVLTLGLSFVGGVLLVRTARQRDALAFGFVLVGAVVATLAIVAPATTQSLNGRVALLDNSTIAPARALGAGVVVVLVLAFTNRLRALYALPIAVSFLAIMVATGSRGPALAVIVALLTAILALRGVRRRRAFVMIALAALGGAWIFSGAAASVRDRFLLLLSDDQGTSVSVRESLWSRAWGQMQEHPFGLGWGNLSPYLQPLSDYPHNILLEIGAEGGLVALALFVVALFLGVRRCVVASRNGDYSALTILALLAYTLANAMVSGDVNDNRAAFVLLGAAVMVQAHARNVPPPRSSRRENVTPSSHPAEIAASSLPRK